MKKLCKALSLLNITALLITANVIDVWADSEVYNAFGDKILTSTEIYKNDFDSITDEDIAEWKYNYSHDVTKHFRVYSDTPTVEESAYSDSDGKAIYLARGKTSYYDRAMQYIVSDDDEEAITSGAYSLTYDFYPAKGTNRLSLVKSSEVVEGMATFQEGTQLMNRSFTSAQRKWLAVSVLIDLDNDKASISMDSKADGQNVYTREITYTNDDLKVFNFYMSGTSVCSASNAAIIDNIRFCKVQLKPQIKFSVTDKKGQIKTDLSEIFKSVKSISIDFGAEMDTETLTDNNIVLKDKDTGTAVPYLGEYKVGGVFIISPTEVLSEFTDYIIEIKDTVHYSNGVSVTESSQQFKTGDSREDPAISAICGDGQEENDFSRIACSIRQIKLNFGEDMDDSTFTDESLKIIDKESGETLNYQGEYDNGIYLISPTDTFVDGNAYVISLTDAIKYKSGKEILEYSYEFKIPAYNYFKQDFNGMTFDVLEGWQSGEVFDEYAASPVVSHYGASTWPGIGYDGTDALYLGICKDGTYYNGNGGYGTFQFKNDYPNRDIEIPISKNLESIGTYILTCDYYPSNGTESLCLRGNQTFAAGYGVENGIRLGNFKSENYGREWCTLTISVDLDNDVASYSVVSKAAGNVLQEGQATYTQSLGIIEIYMEGTGIATRANSVIVDNIEITRKSTGGPIFKDSDVNYYADGVLQADNDSVSPLTNRIEIIPAQDIKMNSITDENIYITAGTENKISSKISYLDGKINICPIESLQPNTTYFVHVQSLTNHQGYGMGYPYEQRFITRGAEVNIDINATQDKSLSEIVGDGKLEISFSATNSEATPKSIRFIAAYYNEDFSELLGIYSVNKVLSPSQICSDEKIEFIVPSGINNIQVSVLDTLENMTQMCEKIEYK